MGDWHPTAAELAVRLHVNLSGGSAEWRLWHEVQIPVPGESNRRCDVWAMRVSWAQWCTRVYEIKVSRSDFLRDVGAGKWRAYLPECNELLFLVPRGLVRHDEVPGEAGLVEIHEPSDKGTRIRTVKRPEYRQGFPSQRMLAALLMSHDTKADRRSGLPRPSRPEDDPYLDAAYRQQCVERYSFKNRHQRRCAGQSAASAVAAARRMESQCAHLKAAAEFGVHVAMRLGCRQHYTMDGSDARWFTEARAEFERREQLAVPDAVRGAVKKLVAACGGEAVFPVREAGVVEEGK